MKVLRFKIPGIPLVDGKTMLVAFAVVSDKVVGVGSQMIPQPEQKALSMLASVSQPSGVRIQSVNGWINAMPPGRPKVIAVVNVFAPCINYSFDFENKGSFGFTGRTLLVELKARLPGACQKAIFEGPVRFEAELESVEQFDSIAVAFEGELHFDALEITV
ncbi:hypothetical protein AWJ14_04445 [Hoeflea olei]|uniref:Uncharacterized protein n=1 Tax=Hoeflea olei TaxID=1480615 RepID=A0A1C1YZY3_9HYPH|nr:hypothetical protein AWJ14_04445 [Hoeflea olei]